MGSTGSPCFQESGFQLADSQLVSLPTKDQHNSTIAPKQEHHVEAIGILKDEDDGDIFAWLKLARSLERNLHLRSGHACLTRDQVRAIAALRHCTINDISAWLHLARDPSGFGIDAVAVSPQVHTWALDQGHTAPSALSDARIPGPVDLSSNHESKEQAATQRLSMQPVPTTTNPLHQAMPKYCCTICGYFRPFKNQSDWKKHEREHDTTYICMLEGPREATPQGAQCAFCGILNPHDDHLLEHNAQVCRQGPPESFSSKRRHEMVNHLSKIHGIRLKSQGEAIAVKWKYTVKKQALSCGFCVNVFVTFNDRLSHIAIQHFEHGQTIDEWDATKVIQGLLQQSGMIKAWGEKMASLPTWEVEDIIWEKDAIIDLQHDLEVGPNDERSAGNLAEAAYIACRMNWGMETQRTMAVAEANFDDTFVTNAFSPHQSQAPMFSAPSFGSNHNQPPPTAQAFNEALPSVAAIQANPLLEYDYSSASVFDLNDSENIDLAPSPFFSQQTQQATEQQGNDDSLHEYPGPDTEGSQV